MTPTPARHVQGTAVHHDREVEGPRVTVGTHNGFAYVGTIVSNTEDGGIILKTRDGQEHHISKARIKTVTPTHAKKK